MTIQTLYRVQCGGACERYLPSPAWVKSFKALGVEAATVVDADRADLFLTFSSAYDEAVRRGWGAYPLLCPDCTRSLMRRSKELADGKVRDGSDPAEDGGEVPEGGQSAQRAAHAR